MMQNKPQKPQKLKAFKFEGFTVAPIVPRNTHYRKPLYMSYIQNGARVSEN